MVRIPAIWGYSRKNVMDASKSRASSAAVPAAEPRACFQATERRTSGTGPAGEAEDRRRLKSWFGATSTGCFAVASGICEGAKTWRHWRAGVREGVFFR